jgi:hypothetical protein
MLPLPSTSLTGSFDHLNAVALSETVAILRPMMHEIVMKILQAQDDAPPAPPPVLLDLLQRQPVDQLWEKISGDFNSRPHMLKRGIKPVGRDLTVYDPAYFLRQAGAAVMGAVAPDSVIRSLFELKIDALFLTGYDCVPFPYWPFVAQSAWEDLTFQFELGLTIRRKMREQVWLEVNEAHCPTFSLNTFWALILLLPHPQGGLIRRFLPALNTSPQGCRAFLWGLFRRRKTTLPVEDYSVKWLAGMADSLREDALRQVAQPGWAGFWDQWLICKALQIWKPWPEKKLEPFFHALLLLPLVQEKLQSQVEEYRQQGILKTAPPWNFGRAFVANERPRWC